MIKHILVLGLLVVCAPLAQASNVFDISAQPASDSEPKPFSGFLDRLDEFLEKKYIDAEDFWQDKPNSDKLGDVLEEINEINQVTDRDIGNVYGIGFPFNDDSIGSGRYIGFHEVRISSVIEKWESNKPSEVVPIPAAAWLFLSGLGLLVFLRRRASGAAPATA